MLQCKLLFFLLLLSFSLFASFAAVLHPLAIISIRLMLHKLNLLHATQIWVQPVNHQRRSISTCTPGMPVPCFFFLLFSFENCAYCSLCVCVCVYLFAFAIVAITLGNKRIQFSLVAVGRLVDRLEILFHIFSA